jgi:hypothetical protein
MTTDDDCRPSLRERLDQRAGFLGRDRAGSEKGNAGATRGELGERRPFGRDVRQRAAGPGNIAAQVDDESAAGHLAQAQGREK